MNIGFEIFLIFLLLIFNGVFALSEIAIVSVRKARLQQRANEGDDRARVALALANAPDDFLSTVQVGITLVGILAGAFGGATIAEKLGEWFNTMAFIAPYGENVGLALVVVTITYFSLIIGELVPKRLALNNPEGVALATAAPMMWLSKAARPLVWFLSGSTTIVVRLLGVKMTEEQSVTEEEIKVLIEQGTVAGTFKEVEQEMIERVFRLADRQVRALMTPRPDIVWLDIAAPESETRRTIAEHSHSFFPVAEDSLDNLLGVVKVKELLSAVMDGKPLDLKTYLRKPLFVPETTPALKVLESFKQSSVHIAIVVDEYGAPQGLVTFNDILESVFSDLPTAVDDDNEPSATQRDDGSWLMDGSIPVDEFTDLLMIAKLSNEDSGGTQTLGGFLMHKLGRIPHAGQHIDWRNFQLEVADMDGRRVDKVLVTPMELLRDPRKTSPQKNTAG